MENTKDKPSGPPSAIEERPSSANGDDDMTPQERRTLADEMVRSGRITREVADQIIAFHEGTPAAEPPATPQSPWNLSEAQIREAVTREVEAGRMTAEQGEEALKNASVQPEPKPDAIAQHLDEIGFPCR